MNTIFIILLLVVSGLAVGMMFQLLNSNHEVSPTPVYHPPVPNTVNSTRRYAGRFNSKSFKV